MSVGAGEVWRVTVTGLEVSVVVKLSMPVVLSVTSGLPAVTE